MVKLMKPKRKREKLRRGSQTFSRDYVPTNGGVRVSKPKGRKKGKKK
jgi:hypothetical protein